MNSSLRALMSVAALIGIISIPAGAQSKWGSPNMTDMDQIRNLTLKPYTGPSVKGIDTSTMTGKVMCGYQGWFGAEGDELGRGWYHVHGKNGFKPGSCNIDLWPDVSELDADERYPTAFNTADGKIAEMFSSFNSKTVIRHFKWMKDYGIDGVFVQRFIGEVSNPSGLRHFNVVLNSCREGANRYGRSYAVMYDLSGLGVNSIGKVIEDWKSLVDKMQVTKDRAYQRHKGKPVVAVWGFGFNDGRAYTLAEGMELVKFLKDDPKYGGCTVMLGVPTYWRTLTRDAVNDTALLDLVKMADIFSPWAVGRFGAPSDAQGYVRDTLSGDIKWSADNHIECLPVVFPGFSWHNMNANSPQNQIPRLGGKFLWTQYAAAKRAGATMIYQAMFDEMDEGTAIFKCTNNPPVGESTFLSYEGLPSDHYLKLVGKASQMIKGKIPVTDEMPEIK